MTGNLISSAADDRGQNFSNIVDPTGRKVFTTRFDRNGALFTSPVLPTYNWTYSAGFPLYYLPGIYQITDNTNPLGAPGYYYIAAAYSFGVGNSNPATRVFLPGNPGPDYNMDVYLVNANNGAFTYLFSNYNNSAQLEMVGIYQNKLWVSYNSSSTATGNRVQLIDDLTTPAVSYQSNTYSDAAFIGTSANGLTFIVQGGSYTTPKLVTYTTSGETVKESLSNSFAYGVPQTHTTLTSTHSNIAWFTRGNTLGSLDTLMAYNLATSSLVSVGSYTLVGVLKNGTAVVSSGTGSTVQMSLCSVSTGSAAFTPVTYGTLTNSLHLPQAESGKYVLRTSSPVTLTRYTYAATNGSAGTGALVLASGIVGNEVISVLETPYTHGVAVIQGSTPTWDTTAVLLTA